MKNVKNVMTGVVVAMGLTFSMNASAGGSAAVVAAIEVAQAYLLDYYKEQFKSEMETHLGLQDVNSENREQNTNRTIAAMGLGFDQMSYMGLDIYERQMMFKLASAPARCLDSTTASESRSADESLEKNSEQLRKRFLVSESQTAVQRNRRFSDFMEADEDHVMSDPSYLVGNKTLTGEDDMEMVMTGLDLRYAQQNLPELSDDRAETGAGRDYRIARENTRSDMRLAHAIESEQLSDQIAQEGMSRNLVEMAADYPGATRQLQQVMDEDTGEMSRRDMLDYMAHWRMRDNSFHERLSQQSADALLRTVIRMKSESMVFDHAMYEQQRRTNLLLARLLRATQNDPARRERMQELHESVR